MYGVGKSKYILSERYGVWDYIGEQVCYAMEEAGLYRPGITST
jgi:hypothetical protein